MRHQHISIFAPKNIIIVTGLLWMFCFAGTASAVSPDLLPFSIDQDALGSRTPLLLIHGLQTNSQNADYWHIWDEFATYYSGENDLSSEVKPYYFTYETLSDSIDGNPTNLYEIGKSLRDEIQARYDSGEFQDKQLIIVAYSMGGLVARSMMQQYQFTDGDRGGNKIARLITLGTPHHGTPAANNAYMYRLDLFINVYQDFLLDLSWDSIDNLVYWYSNPGLQHLNHYQYAPGYYSKIIAYGAEVDRSVSPYYVTDDSLIPGFEFLEICGYSNDGIVPLISAVFSGVTGPTRRLVDATCDHTTLPQGTCTVNGAALFDTIKADILSAISATKTPAIDEQ